MLALIEALTQRITTDGILGGLLAQSQVYTGRAPETALMPFLTLDIRSGKSSDHDFSGDRLTEVTAEFTAVGASLPVLLEIGDRLVSLLDAVSFPLSSGILLGAYQLHPPEPALTGVDASDDEVYRVKTPFRCQVFQAAGV